MKTPLQNLTNTFLKISIALTFLLISSSTFATIRLVDNINDSGNGSLRQAVTVAANGDTIRFNPTLISMGNNTITLTSEITFSKTLTIIGLYNSTDTLFISGNNNNRIFGITNTTNVNLDSLVLINGNGIGATSPGNGGAVLITNSDSLFILNSIIKNNNIISTVTASRVSGGGIYSPDVQVTISNSIISGNTLTAGSNSSAIGGAIYTSSPYASIIVDNSTISNNKMFAGTNGFGIGAAMYTDSSSITISRSTINGNSILAGDDGNAYGGGIFSNSLVTVHNSTFNKNIANGGDGGNAFGGGICALVSPVTISNSTFSGNVVSAAPVGVASGAGVYTYSSVNIIGSIFDENDINSLGSNSVTSNGYNIFTDAPAGTVGTDNINVNPVALNLLPLAYNGGTTQTMSPDLGSVAIDMGNPSDMSDAQNRAISGGRRDVGAAEFESCVATASTFSVTAITCEGYTLPSGDSTYTVIGTHTANDVINNAAGCDSVMTISITINDIMDQSITSATTSFCDNGATTIDLASSETGMDYFLRDNDNDTIVDGPIAGTGSTISLNTGTFSQTMTYNVLARSQKELDTAALELSGSNNSVIIDNNSSFDFNTGTIEMWVNPGTVQFGNEGIFSMRTAFATTRISIHLNANLSTVGIYNTEDGWNPVTVSGLSNNNWTHLAFVIKASGSDLYINGVFNTTINADMDRSKNLLPVVFGSINDGPSEFFHGKIDEVRIWNVERTAIEILDNYLKANVNTTTGLIASYDFYEATDTIVHDAGPNGFEGALVNMNANNWVSGVNNEEACEQVMTQTVSVNVNVIDTAVTSTSTTLTAAETGATYQWLDCNNNMSVISNETNQSFTATVNGSYAAAITKNGCTDTSACKTIASIGINENGLQETFVLYPNPTAGIFTIKTGNEISNAKITIYTVDGKVLLNQMINTKVTVIDLKNFNSGIYFVEIQNGETISTKRIIKQ